MINIKLFLEVRQAILSNHRRVAMDVAYRYRSCGTVGCIAGWACMIAADAVHRPFRNTDKFFHHGFPRYFLFRHVDWFHVSTRAMQLLGMTFEETYLLFHFHDNGLRHLGFDPLSDKLIRCRPGSPEYAAVVVEAIDRFLAAKGFDVAALLQPPSPPSYVVEEEEEKELICV